MGIERPFPLCLVVSAAVAYPNRRLVCIAVRLYKVCRAPARPCRIDIFWHFLQYETELFAVLLFLTGTIHLRSISCRSILLGLPVARFPYL